MRFVPAVVLALLALTVLSGCTAKSATSSTTTSDVSVQATPTTGVIRGVVVDEAIRPLAGAVLTATSGDKTVSTNSSATGSFGFQGLAPGVYFVKAHKPGYRDTQASTEVKAGDSDPPALKLLLPLDNTFVKPYFVASVFKGFIDCAVTTPGFALAVCSVPNGLCVPGSVTGPCSVQATGNVTADNFSTFIPVDGGVPLWIQHELVWKPTQTAGDQFILAARNGTLDEFKSGQYDKDLPNQPTGVSPLLAVINTTTIQKFNLGRYGVGLEPAIFAGGVPGTGDQACAPGTPATNPFCAFDTGTTLEQDFKLYTHIFYGFTPPEGYRFTKDGDPTPPQ